MKTLFTALLIGWLTNGVWAQSYNFSIHQQSYQDLQNEHLITNDTLAPYGLLILGSDYRVFGHDLGDTLNIGVNGWVTSTSNYYSFALDPLIGNYHFPDTNSRISYEQISDPGNNLLKVQWKNIGTDGDPSERLNFQLWIYEKDQMVEFHFGPGTSSNSFVSGIFRFKRDFTQTLEEVELSGNPASPGINTGTFFLSGKPANGSIYRFSYLRASLEMPGAKEIGIYPNPGSGSFRVNAENVKAVKAYTRLGSQVKIDGQNGIYSLNDVVPGVYFLHFEMEDGSLAQARLIVND